MVRFVDAIESERALRVAARTGQVLPANCTSVGKALLAELGRDQVRALYPEDDLPLQTAPLDQVDALPGGRPRRGPGHGLRDQP